MIIVCLECKSASGNHFNMNVSTNQVQVSDSCVVSMKIGKSANKHLGICQSMSWFVFPLKVKCIRLLRSYERVMNTVLWQVTRKWEIYTLCDTADVWYSVVCVGTTGDSMRLRCIVWPCLVKAFHTHTRSDPTHWPWVYAAQPEQRHSRPLFTIFSINL